MYDNVIKEFSKTFLIPQKSPQKYRLSPLDY